MQKPHLQALVILDLLLPVALEGVCLVSFDSICVQFVCAACFSIFVLSVIALKSCAEVQKEVRWLDGW